MNDMFEDLKILKQKLNLSSGSESVKTPSKKTSTAKTAESSEEKELRLQKEFEEYMRGVKRL
jgi:hypothetical protein